MNRVKTLVPKNGNQYPFLVPRKGTRTRFLFRELGTISGSRFQEPNTKLTPLPVVPLRDFREIDFMETPCWLQQPSSDNASWIENSNWHMNQPENHLFHEIDFPKIPERDYGEVFREKFNWSEKYGMHVVLLSFLSWFRIRRQFRLKLQVCFIEPYSNVWHYAPEIEFSRFLCLASVFLAVFTHHLVARE